MPFRTYLSSLFFHLNLVFLVRKDLKKISLCLSSGTLNNQFVLVARSGYSVCNRFQEICKLANSMQLIYGVVVRG